MVQQNKHLQVSCDYFPNNATRATIETTKRRKREISTFLVVESVSENDDNKQIYTNYVDGGYVQFEGAISTH